jgi:hypothetical protein
MDKLKLIFSSVGMIFGILALTKTLSYDITMPILDVCLGMVCLCSGVINVRTGKKNSAFFDFLLGTLFLLLVIVRLMLGL